MKRLKFYLLTALTVLGLGSALNANAQTQSWTGHAPNTVSGEFFLYNVGTGQFITQGGVWGTCAVMSDAGMKFRTIENGASNDTYRLKTYHGDNDHQTMVFSNGIELDDPGYFFLDQKFEGTNYANPSSFTFTSVGDNVYLLSVTSDQGKTEAYQGTFFLRAEQRSGNCVGVKGLTVDKATDNDKWIIVTLADFDAAFNALEGTKTTPVPAPHLVTDAGFYRENDKTAWKLSTSGVSAGNYWIAQANGQGEDLRNDSKYNDGITPADATKTTTKTTYTYTVTYHYGRNSTHTFTWPSTEKYEVGDRLNPTVSCGNNHKYQSITYQEIKSIDKETTTTEGGYVYHIGNGYNMYQATGTFEDGKYYTTKYYQQLFGGYWTANIHGTEGVIYQTVTINREGWYKISAKGFSTKGGYLYALAGTNQQAADKYATQPFAAPDALPETYVKAAQYVNTLNEQGVYVKVNAGETLTFGVRVEGADADSWTCFDDVTLSYCGKVTYDLIINENETDIAYLNSQVDMNAQTLRLVRTFKTGSWNSLVLPVSLSVDQVKSAFGAGTKLSKLDRCDKEVIYFEPVNLNQAAGTNAIEAGTLYIIKPQTGMEQNKENITRTLTGGSTVQTGTEYYTIPLVLLNTELQSATVSTSDIEGAEVVSGGTLKMVGTYVKKGTSVNNGQAAIPANAYVLGVPSTEPDKTRTRWYYNTVATNNVKGLRGWLETTASEAEAKSMIFSINGVEERADAGTVTGIGSVESHVDAPANRNVYNINGQRVRSNASSLEGLPKGVYIVNGKKVIVK